MAIRSTYRPRFGPFTVNTGMNGPTSVTVRAFGVTYRLWNKKGDARGVSSVDLPGPFSWRPKKKMLF